MFLDITFNDILNIKAFWGLLGTCIGGFLFWLGSRKVLRLQGVAAESLAATLDRRIQAVEKERDEYRDKLHAERNERQAIELRAKELEARPDLTSLTTLLSDQKDWMRALGKDLAQHTESDARVFGKIEESLTTALTRFPEQLEKMSKAFDERQEAALAAIRESNLRSTKPTQ